MRKEKGKLILIEGVDSVGKSSQLKLLAEALMTKGFNVGTRTYPNYKGRYGFEITKYLNGEFGNAAEVDPILAGSLYTLDRLTDKDKLISDLESGMIILCDRSTFSNAAFQGTKGENWYKQKEIFNWFVKAEFDTLGLPKPDHVIFLKGHPSIMGKLFEKRNTKDSVAKGGKKDQHEANSDMLSKAYNLYFDYAKKTENWSMVAVHEGDDILTRETVHKTIMDIVLPIVS